MSVSVSVMWWQIFPDMLKHHKILISVFMSIPIHTYIIHTQHPLSTMMVPSIYTLYTHARTTHTRTHGTHAICLESVVGAWSSTSDAENHDLAGYIPIIDAPPLPSSPPVYFSASQR